MQTRQVHRFLLYPYTPYTHMAFHGQQPRTGDAGVIPTRFSGDEVARIDRVRSRFRFPSRSAFIREAVLEKVDALERTKVVEVRDVSETEAIRLIDRYIQKHPGVHQVDEIADELGIELRVAFAAAEKLIGRGRARARGA